ncbi:hypothetical protein PVL29_021069 [Vitis rotundifolia]|uniref:Uncharacterized protein n=1 Tax=Vitis rotundifolia TaxID=103349 RepID=A0AA38YYG3_VITRO|nr:hypothetical protein PVL29_021069 [Vitis rotundifolia]
MKPPTKGNVEGRQASTINGNECAKVVDGEYLSSIGKTVEVNDHVEFGIGGRVDVVLRKLVVGFVEDVTRSY